MSPPRLVLAVVAGLVLAAVPFLRYAHLGGRGEAHVDHEPRHGGQLGMAGEHHIEVRRRAGRVETFVSDAWRRPLRPRRGWIVFDRGDSVPLVWEDGRLSAPDRASARELEAVVLLEDDTRLALSFDFSPSAGGAAPRGSVP